MPVIPAKARPASATWVRRPGVARVGEGLAAAFAR